MLVNFSVLLMIICWAGLKAKSLVICKATMFIPQLHVLFTNLPVLVHVFLCALATNFLPF